MTGTQLRRQADRRAVIREALRSPDVRRIELGWGLSVVGEFASTVALVVFAYAAGGAGLIAVYGLFRMLAGVTVALAIAGIGDRVRGEVLLRASTALKAILLTLAAVTAAVDGPPLAVVALAAGSSGLEGAYRPLQASTLPWLVRTPAELTAANVVASMMESGGALVGPVLAGVLLALADPTAAIALAATFFGFAWLSLRRLTVASRSPAASRSTRVLHDMATGVKAFVRLAPPGGVTILVFAQTFVRGAVTVLIAVLAVDVLVLGEQGVGWLNAALGVGGLVGGVVAGAVIRVTRLGRSFIAGLLLWGMPLVLLSLVLEPVVAYLAFVAIGIGNAVEDVGAFTLLTRLLNPRMTARVLGVVELAALGGIGLGSVAAPSLLDAFDMRGTLALLGLGLTGLTIAHARRFARIDRTMPQPGKEVDLLRGLPMFAPLPLAVIELLSTELRPHRFAPGTVVVREGDPGEEFHIIASGSASVTVRGTPRPPLGPGDCFGEIALLRDLPRTATITAIDELHTLALGREEFLAAVTGNTTSSLAAESLVTQRLGQDPPVGVDQHGDAPPVDEPVVRAEEPADPRRRPPTGHPHP
jgi:Cyclic nucleotide-binding domain/Major Facilitator Superfamily